MEEADDLLERYKRHPFAKGLLPFIPTLAELGVPSSKIVAKQDGRQRWVICDRASGKPALFSHATRYAEGDCEDTGNYVPDGEEVPVGLDAKRVQRRANTRCFYTYIFDTYVDWSLYEGQWLLDDYMKTVKGFNPSSLPRRAYLSGHEEKYRSRFWMQTPMFLRKKDDGNLDHLHPWVVAADRMSKVFSANPDCPRVWVKTGDEIVPIAETEVGCLQRGDVLTVSFSVTYHIASAHWFPQFHPADIVVLKSGDGDVTDYSAPVIDLHTRPPPSFEAGEGADEGDGGVRGGSSKAEESVEEEAEVVGVGGERSLVPSSNKAEEGEDNAGDSRSGRSSLTADSLEKGVPDVGGELEYPGSEIEEDVELRDEEFEAVGGEGLKRRARGGRVGRSTRRRV